MIDKSDTLRILKGLYLLKEEEEERMNQTKNEFHRESIRLEIVRIEQLISFYGKLFKWEGP